MEKIVKEAYDFLTNHLWRSNMEQLEIQYRIEHSMRVANIAKYLAEKEDANVKICYIGGLLHDVGKFDTEVNRDHGRVSAEVAQQFLQTTGLTEKEQRDICYAIAVHVDGQCGYDYEETLESKIVSDADNLDRFGAYRVYQTMEWDQESVTGDIEERKAAVQKKIQLRKRYRDEVSLETKTADVIWKDYLDFQIEYFERYLEELYITNLAIYNV